MRYLFLLCTLLGLAANANAEGAFAPLAERQKILKDRYSKHTNWQRYFDPFDVTKPLRLVDVTNEDQVVFQLKKGKCLHIKIEFRGHKEQLIRVSPLRVSNEAILIRNNSEASTEPKGKAIKYGEYNYADTYGPYDLDATIVIEGFSKDCFIGKKCHRRPWHREPVVIESHDQSSKGYFWYDDSRHPPSAKNMAVTVEIKN